MVINRVFNNENGIYMKTEIKEKAIYPKATIEECIVETKLHYGTQEQINGLNEFAKIQLSFWTKKGV